MCCSNRLLAFMYTASRLQTTEMGVKKTETFCIELDSGPVYLKATKNALTTDSPSSESLFNGMNVFYMSSFTSDDTFARNINHHHQLKQVLEAALPGKGEIIQGIAYNSEIFERGYFVRVPFNGESLASKLKKAGKDFNVVSFRSLIPTSDASAVYMKEEAYFRKVVSYGETNLELGLANLPDIHPAFLSRKTNSVYHDIQRCYDVLNEYESKEEIQQLREICAKYIQGAEDWKDGLPLQAKNPVIVIEGLDATGKTTLTKNLGKHLDAAVLKSPPECLCHLRRKFDSYPQLLRRAFYSLGNYAFAKMIQDASSDGTVIVDRFWNSTAAYAIATDVGVGGVECLPPVGHWVYSWPLDLLKPNAVFLLTISDEERRRRLKGRGIEKTDEEIKMEVSYPFRQRLEEAYNRMENPSLQKIDASGMAVDVLNKTLEILKSRQLI